MAEQPFMRGERVVVVVPSVREQHLRQFLDAWRDEFASATVLVVEDHGEREFDLGDLPNVVHLCWHDIDRELGASAWIVPRQTDCVRSFGYYKAWQLQPRMIVTLDDDCLPGPSGARGFLERHWQRLEEGGHDRAWVSTVEGTVPRGVPYYSQNRQRRCVINHGLWTNVPDYDAPTQLLQARVPTPCELRDQTIPAGSYFPMCGMNLAFRPEVVPALYFLLMGRNHPVDRFGDIWCGVFVKRICDHLGLAVNSGAPAVEHQRASNVFANLRKEAPAMEWNETLWRLVDDARLTATTFGACYRQLAEAIAGHGDPYFARLAEAMSCWADLFDPVLLPRRAKAAPATVALGQVPS
ncbi:MAG: hypothetical protein R3F56_07990 [Planctomycetota bacterium]